MASSHHGKYLKKRRQEDKSEMISRSIYTEDFSEERLEDESKLLRTLTGGGPGKKFEDVERSSRRVRCRPAHSLG